MPCLAVFPASQILAAEKLSRGRWDECARNDDSEEIRLENGSRGSDECARNDDSREIRWEGGSRGSDEGARNDDSKKIRLEGGSGGSKGNPVGRPVPREQGSCGHCRVRVVSPFSTPLTTTEILCTPG